MPTAHSPARSNSAATGALSTGCILTVIVVAIAVIMRLIVFVERAQRRLLIQYPKRQVGNRMFQGDTSHLPLKLNTSPALSRRSSPRRCCCCRPRRQASQAIGNARLGDATISALGHGQPFMVLRLLIAFFAFFYTAIVFNPKDTADNLKKHGGFIPGIRPGRADRRVYRLCADPHHRRRRCLPRLCLRDARVLIARTGVPFIPWWHFAADRGQCNDRHGCSDPGSSYGPSV
jgi:hypothetical protein